MSEMREPLLRTSEPVSERKTAKSRNYGSMLKNPLTSSEVLPEQKPIAAAINQHLNNQDLANLCADYLDFELINIVNLKTKIKQLLKKEALSKELRDLCGIFGGLTIITGAAMLIIEQDMTPFCGFMYSFGIFMCIVAAVYAMLMDNAHKEFKAVNNDLQFALAQQQVENNSPLAPRT